LGDDGSGEHFFDFAVEADDAFFEEAGEDVGGLDAARDGFGYEGHGEGGCRRTRWGRIVEVWEELKRGDCAGC
jgi:hypothetical protein